RLLFVPVTRDRPISPLPTRRSSDLEAGARWASYIFLRLPHEVAPLFQDWLEAHMPMRAEHVMSLVRSARDGKDYSSAFGERMRGTGEIAELIRRRFRLACKRAGLNLTQRPVLDCTAFRAPNLSGQQQLL